LDIFEDIPTKMFIWIYSKIFQLKMFVWIYSNIFQLKMFVLI
jgi:hypothetical protein